jgi:hypothetical protein
MAFANLAAFVFITPSHAQSLPGLAQGMSQEMRGIWIETGVREAERKAILGRIGAAQQAMRQIFGGLYATPQWHICASPACDQNNNMTSRAMTYGVFLITMSSKAVADPTTYVHELTHAQMASAMPLSLGGASRLPAWFDEGIATLASKSVGYPAQSTACAAEKGKPPPKNREEFQAFSRQSGGAGPVYTRSACAVNDWLAGRPLRAARDHLAKVGQIP